MPSQPVPRSRVHASTCDCFQCSPQRRMDGRALLKAVALVCVPAYAIVLGLWVMLP